MLNKITKSVLDALPKTCEYCGSERISFWEEKSNKFVFRCIDCGVFYPISTTRGLNIKK